ncbi:MAG TPA: SET domain-containing protein [Spirochaetia bacterium]|nr:SET domain-containing protein [Spirochaetia bacterium]
MRFDVRDGAYGKAVYAAERIPAGTLIAPFTGPFLRYAETNADTYALQIGPDLYIGESGDVDDLFNHSCDPNAWVKIQGRTVELRALRDILPGEQICFDYSTIMDEDDFTMKCACGSPHCRGTIRDGRLLPDEVWNRYVALGILPDYVKESRARGSR